MSEMQKNYDPKLLEQQCYEQWEKKGLFRCGQTNDVPYTIMLPPPNITGTLHMGHGFQQALMDLLTRYHRMTGSDALWQPGCFQLRPHRNGGAPSRTLDLVLKTQGGIPG